MTPYASLADDFYVNMNLATEMELPGQRETILHFFECVQKKYPSMRKFYCRDKRDFVLEEDKDQGRYRWAAVETKRLCSGQVNPPSLEAVLDQHRLVLDLAPPLLSISPLDCEALDLLFGFDFGFRSRGRNPRGPGDQLRAIAHHLARRGLPCAGARQHRNPHECLSGAHR